MFKFKFAVGSKNVNIKTLLLQYVKKSVKSSMEGLLFSTLGEYIQKTLRRHRTWI